jgi:hypothetical protein
MYDTDKQQQVIKQDWSNRRSMKEMYSNHDAHHMRSMKILKQNNNTNDEIRHHATGESELMNNPIEGRRRRKETM